MDKYNETLEKAKAYDEALKLMRDCVPDEDGLVHVRPSDIFSELAESGDERIRKRLIFDFQALEKTEWGGLEVKDILAWLEKLKVFAEHGDGLYHFGNNVFTYVGNPTWDNVSWLEKQGTSYTKMDVDDAFFEGMAFAKNELEKQKPAWSKKDDVMVHDILGWLPAKSRPEYNQRRVDWLKSLKGRVQPKQEWSEEDEGFLNLLLAIFTNEHPNGVFSTDGITVFKGNCVTSNKIIAWLKSLKDRVQPQPKQEWKQENREELTEFENAMMHIGGSFFGENAGLDPNDTATIKEQAELLLELAPKTEWSKEDEKMYRGVMVVCDTWSTASSFYPKENECAERLKNWLKSLKTRITWRPSDEQMYMLEWLTTNVLDNGVVGNKAKEVLNTLIEQLKSL